MANGLEGLIMLSQGDDKRATEEIIKIYDALIWKCVRCFHVNGYSGDDLAQVARMALYKAIKNFDVQHGANFTGYADMAIRNELRSLLRKKSNVISNISIESVNGDGVPHIELLEDDMNIECDYINKIHVDELRQAFTKLSIDEQEFIRIVFGGYGGLKTYVTMKGINYQKGRRIKAKIIEKLRNFMLEE